MLLKYILNFWQNLRQCSDLQGYDNTMFFLFTLIVYVNSKQYFKVNYQLIYDSLFLSNL